MRGRTQALPWITNWEKILKSGSTGNISSGYNHRIGDKSIELESIKCFASSGIGYQAKPVVSEVSSDPVPLRFIDSYVNGSWKQIPVFQWEKVWCKKSNWWQLPGYEQKHHGFCQRRLGFFNR